MCVCVQSFEFFECFVISKAVLSYVIGCSSAAYIGQPISSLNSMGATEATEATEASKQINV